MSRAGTQDVVVVRAANNVYTVLSIIALLVVIASMYALWAKAEILLGKGGLTG